MDLTSLARLLAWFEASGCQGVVLAGTTGEGPSLSAAEKRDLIRAAVPLRGRLKLLLGVATPSLTEAQWLCKQAATAGADAVLLMPPMYYRNASQVGILAWMEAVVDSSPLPVVLYNFPQMTGSALSAQMVAELCTREHVVGLKDSSGDAANLRRYRESIPGNKRLFVGDETLLVHALDEGWDGTISGCANVVAGWLAQVVQEHRSGRVEPARVKYELVEPALLALRGLGNLPSACKAVLQHLGLIDGGAVRAPLEPVDGSGVAELLADRLGLAPGKLGV